ncbi:hypothetical protein LUZ61_017324 [Rhynchospora tenuis]|uniref:Uncharacterized protein n=1 Tax=Rhynchospora tenuis TaxID=198213 RepID=A0AAD5Z780_9POAL|nr:hypothetical protein LUZ61_017324 [Rhynchospora tenuis]
MEELSLIDVSTEDDFLVSPGNDGFLDDTTPIGCTHQFGSTTKEEEVRTKVTNLNEEIPELCQSPEYKSSKSGINLRKSLAWDSAFFTCEGVLNTEELSIINTTFGQTEKSSLAGIPEERRSGESTTTLDTDNWTLESLETELFDNIRASIQKSIGGLSEKEPNPTSGNSGKNKKKEGSNLSRLSSKEKVTRAPQNKVKVATGEKKAALPPKQPQNIWKRASLDSKILAAGGSGVQSKTASVNAPRMSSKPTLPKTLPKTPASPVNIQKRSSTGSALTRKPVPKPTQAPSTSTSRSMMGPPRCAPKTSTSRSMTGPPRCAPNNSLGTSKKTLSVASPSPKTKSPVGIMSKRPATTTKTPTRASSKSKIGVSNNLNPLSRLPSISPRSSIDSVRSTNTTDSVGLGSPISLSGLSSSRDFLHGSLSRSSSSSSIASQDPNLKPSGLRLPSKKLGYFDAGKPQLNSLQKSGFFASPQINAVSTSTVKPASNTVTEDSAVTSQRDNVVEKENITPLYPTESGKMQVSLLEEKISSLSLS